MSVPLHCLIVFCIYNFRPFSKSDTHTTGERWAVNAIDEVGVSVISMHALNVSAENITSLVKSI